ncbi:MAG: hypothetical protein HC822_22355 [Oscillochloris sp.]|nr:hypothetical protein [Oscillochloris sp.]
MVITSWARGLSLLAVFLVTLALLPTSSVQAASSVIVKTSEGDKTEDNGACSLREALQALYVPSNDDCGNLSDPLTITFDAPGTIQMKGGTLPFISKSSPSPAR